MINNLFHWLILTGVPYENSGGAQRAAQISKTLLEIGHKVSYVYAINYNEKKTINVDIPRSSFQTSYVRNFSSYKFIKNLNLNNKLIILIEVPHPSFLPIIKTLKRYSTKIIYDLIDPWDTELGHGWYHKSIEYEIIKQSNIFTATAIKLQSQLKQKTNKPVHLIPNAYDNNLFIKKIYERPMDLPPEPIIGYVGALWGSWFDIDLVFQVARQFPKYNIVLIGEYLNQFNNIAPSNVYFLNIKAQKDLPPYLSYFNVALIPFKTNKLTEGVNPLKVYEYLAMGLPVVSTLMPELENIPSIFLAEYKKDFIEKINIASSTTVDFSQVANWLEQNTWKSRINRLLELINSQ